MNVSLTKKLEKWVRDQVKGGNFETASEVVRDALRDAMRREDELARLRADIAEGIADAKAGRTRVLDDALLKEIRQRSRALRGATKRKSA
ncbi:MAG: type II toxin-antitoxin system ParD family antitoxin [Phycisphaerales bacterium]|nr:type II toxin-antitoxin system ParD family antitoxin [Phycisphaerales bacterium]